MCSYINIESVFFIILHRFSFCFNTDKFVKYMFVVRWFWSNQSCSCNML